VFEIIGGQLLLYFIKWFYSFTNTCELPTQVSNLPSSQVLFIMPRKLKSSLDKRATNAKFKKKGTKQEDNVIQLGAGAAQSKTINPLQSFIKSIPCSFCRFILYPLSLNLSISSQASPSRYLTCDPSVRGYSEFHSFFFLLLGLECNDSKVRLFLTTDNGKGIVQIQFLR